MVGKPRERRTVSNLTRRTKSDINSLYSIKTRNKIVQTVGIAPTGSGGSAGGGRFLPITGGTMAGVIGSQAASFAISSGDLDLTQTSAGDEIREQGIIFVSPEAGSTDTLDTITISNSFPAGGRILLVGIATNTLTVTHESGTGSGLKKEITFDSGADATITDTETLELFYDVVEDKFHAITSPSTGTHITASLSADQTTNLGANDHIEFDTRNDGDITLETGAGQADGIFQLKANRTYVLFSSLRPEFSSGTAQVVTAWYDRTGAAEIGKRTKHEPETGANDDANQPIAMTTFTPTVDSDVEVRIISVSNINALENESTTAVIHEIGGASGGGGGSGTVNFPIEPTLSDEGNTTGAKTIDLSSGDGHVWKVTLTGDVTLSFSNYPSSGEQREWEIEWVQDGTGGHTVTHPAEVVESVSLSSGASTTTIVTYRTNDGGTNVHAIPALRGSISLGGGSFASTALDNLSSPTLNVGIDANNNEISGLNYIESNAGTPATQGRIRLGNNEIIAARNAGNSANHTLKLNTSDDFEIDTDLDVNGNDVILDVDGDTNINSNSDDTLQLVVGGSARFSISNTSIVSTLKLISEVDVNGNDLTLDADADSKIEAATDDTINFWTLGVKRLSLDTSELQLQGGVHFDVNGNRLIMDTDGDSYITNNGDDVIEFFTGTFERFSIDNSELKLTGGINLDINGNDMIIDVDGDTAIGANGDDSIQFKVGGIDVLQVNGAGQLNWNTSGVAHTIDAGATSFEIGLSAVDDEFKISHSNTDSLRVVADSTNSANYTYVEGNATREPNIRINDTSAVADGAVIGRVNFTAVNDNSGITDYAQIIGIVEENADTAEDGTIRFDVRRGGSLSNIMNLRGALLTSGGLRIGFFGVNGSTQATSTNSTPTADLTYSSNERDMIQDMWDALVGYGLLDES